MPRRGISIESLCIPSSHRKPDQRKIGDDARIASPNSVRPVRLNSSPVIATVPAVPGGSLVPAGLDCGGGAVAQADKRTIMESNDFIFRTLQ